MSKQAYQQVPQDADFDEVAGEPSSSSAAPTVPLLSQSAKNDSHTGLLDPEPTQEGVLPAYQDNPYVIEIEEPPPFSLYEPSKKSISTGNILSHDAHLNSDGEALYRWLKEECKVAPRPLVHIIGTHRQRITTEDNGKTETRHETVTDFDLLFDVSECLLNPGQPGLIAPVSAGRKTHRGGRRKITAQFAEIETTRTIRDWCDIYCRDNAALKVFTMRKYILNQDQEKFKKHLTWIIKSTNYRGNIRISFPVHSRNVILTSDHWIQKLRYSIWRYIFYLTFAWIFTWPFLWWFTHQYHVVEASWKFADYDGQRRITRLSEEEWAKKWEPAITKLVRSRRQGWVLQDDLELALEENRRRAMDRQVNPEDGFLQRVAVRIHDTLDRIAEGSESLGGGWGSDSY